MPRKRDKGRSSIRQREKDRKCFCLQTWLVDLKIIISLLSLSPATSADLSDITKLTLTGDGFGICVLLVAIVYVYTVHLLLKEFCSLFTHCLVANPYCFSSCHQFFSFYLILHTRKEVKKGEPTLSWGPWQAGGLAGFNILLDSGNCLLTFGCGLLPESEACAPSLFSFCLHSEIKLTGSKRRNSHTRHNFADYPFHWGTFGQRDDNRSK